MPLMVWPTVAFMVWSSAPAAAVTSTVVVVAPTERGTLIVSVSPTCTCWLATLYMLKPCLVTVML